MTVVQLETVVLQGVIAVACDVAISLMRNGFNQVGRQTPTTSLARHLYPSLPLCGADPGMRDGGTAMSGAASAAKRAGRSVSSAGVLDNRCLAISARQAIQSGWYLVEGGPCSTPAVRLAPLAGRTSADASVGKELLEHRRVFPRKPLQTEQQPSLLSWRRGENRPENVMAAPAFAPAA